jgi:diaminohydroxyphosphoribosylaminopyrimidine deaminase/5-amino-6-(5-phosphoribosylamino)uracil reductase
MMSVLDTKFMALAIQLARKGLYTTRPNPRVGCVIVNNGAIVGQGFHYRAGEAHAEVNALAEAAEQTKGATSYVTLEPCSHYGRTPPCAKALIEAGIVRVVVAMQDPNPAVAGRGLTMLRDAGVEVVSGVLEQQARALNPGFINRMNQGLPFVRVKLAMSVDGRTAMASGESKWITGPEARADVQRLRARSCAILTAAGTVLADNPALNVRAGQCKLENIDDVLALQPARVVIDPKAQLTGNEAVFDANARSIYVTDEKLAKRCTLSTATLRNTETVGLPVNGHGHFQLDALLVSLARRDINEVLVEAGASLAGSFIQQGYVDELLVYMAPKLLGSNARALAVLPYNTMAQSRPLALIDQRMLGDDIKFTYRFEGL